MQTLARARGAFATAVMTRRWKSGCTSASLWFAARHMLTRGTYLSRSTRFESTPYTPVWSQSRKLPGCLLFPNFRRGCPRSPTIISFSTSYAIFLVSSASTLEARIISSIGMSVSFPKPIGRTRCWHKCQGHTQRRFKSD
jgi:hypothetical protein